MLDASWPQTPPALDVMKLATLLAASASLVAANFNHNVKVLRPPSLMVNDIPNMGTFFFDQYIDHEDKELGTFKQKVWWSDEFYKGPGSPVSAALLCVYELR